MSPSHARRRSSRGRPSTEDLYRADKELSKQNSLRQRFLRFLRHKLSPEATSDRNSVARKDSLKLAIRNYSAQPRFWTDIYDNFPPPTQPAAAKGGYTSTYTGSPATQREQSVHHDERTFRAKDGLRGSRDELILSNEDRARESVTTDEEYGAEQRCEMGRPNHEDPEAGDRKQRPKKRVHFAI